jgi:hypothetical protein
LHLAARIDAGDVGALAIALECALGRPTPATVS